VPNFHLGRRLRRLGENLGLVGVCGRGVDFCV
jgi:hypothetical protein